MQKEPFKTKAVTSVQSLTCAPTLLLSTTTTIEKQTLIQVPWMVGVLTTLGAKRTTASVILSKLCALSSIPVLQEETENKHSTMTGQDVNSTTFVQITIGKTGIRR